MQTEYKLRRVKLFMMLAVLIIAAAGNSYSFTLESMYLLWEIDSTGRNVQFTDKLSGVNYYTAGATPFFSYINVDWANYPSTSATYNNGSLVVEYGAVGITVGYNVTTAGHYISFEVSWVTGNIANVKYLVFGNCCTTLIDGDTAAPFMACAIACNYKTKGGVVTETMPGPNSRVGGTAYSQFGLLDAKVGIVAVPPSEFRTGAKYLIQAQSWGIVACDKGGPWALDSADAKASYVIDFVGITTSTVNDWVNLCTTYGTPQIDFHESFEHGLFTPEPSLYPNGISDIQSIISTLHANGKKAGYHNYSMFISKNSPYVAPIPDSRLAYKESFTLAQPMTSTGTTIYVNEDIPTDMNTTTGFLIANSVTMWIDNELITYTGIDRVNNAFTGCTRGSCGTTAVSHSVAAQVKHIKEMFNCFVPSPDSTLLVDVASDIADVINTCGFDMVYFDAIDGAYSVYDTQDYWYYQAKFIYEVMSRCTNKPVCEMSTMSHHFWAYRSRLGAWDTPYRGAKSIVDVHCMANDVAGAMFLPANMGWWKIWDYEPVLFERTTYDIMEYLCWKNLAYDRSISLMQFEQPSVSLPKPNIQRLGGLNASAEYLRTTNYFSQAVKDEVKVLGNEFRWVNTGGVHTLEPTQYAPHLVLDRSQSWSKTWTTYNKFGSQPVKLRIEAEPQPKSYTTSGYITAFDTTQAANVVEAAAGVSAVFTPGTTGTFTVTNNSVTDQKKAWARVGRIYSSPLSFLPNDQVTGLVFSLTGDNKGELVNFQLKTTAASGGGILDRYIPINFTGTKTVYLVEAEGDAIFDWGWPYIVPKSDWSSTALSTIQSKAWNACITQAYLYNVGECNVYVTNIPMGQTVTVKFNSIRAHNYKTGVTLSNPNIAINGATITFPTSLTPGQYIEFKSLTDCKVYDSYGTQIASITPTGTVPTLNAGNNTVTYNATVTSPNVGRTMVTVISYE